MSRSLHRLSQPCTAGFKDLPLLLTMQRGAVLCTCPASPQPLASDVTPAALTGGRVLVATEARSHSGAAAAAAAAAAGALAGAGSDDMATPVVPRALHPGADDLSVRNVIWLELDVAALPRQVALHTGGAAMKLALHSAPCVSTAVDHRQMRCACRAALHAAVAVNRSEL